VEKQVEVIEMEIIPDHVHLVCEIHQEFHNLRSRLPTLWTNAYFVATVGGALLEVIKQYIENQKAV
jgi:putative transposase